MSSRDYSCSWESRVFAQILYCIGYSTSPRIPPSPFSLFNHPTDTTCSPTSELPKLKYPHATYAGEHWYTIVQIVLTAGIFAITFTPAAPAFPVIIVLLAPVRLKIMNRYWGVNTLKGVDSWACRPGLGNDFRSTKERREEEEEMAVEEARGGAMASGIFR